MADRYFSDLHCHNHMRAHFQMQVHKDKFTAENKYSPWTVIMSNERNLQKGTMGASYSQIDLVKCWKSNLRLTFNSLYPLEKQFVKGSNILKGKNKLLRILTTAILGKDGIRRDLLQSNYMRIPDAVVDYFQSDGYDYWESLQREKEFVCMDSGKVISQNKIHLPNGLLRNERLAERRAKQDPETYFVQQASYLIPKNRAELKKSLQNKDEITMILTIEGAHALGTDTVKSITTISKRVQSIKNDWDEPIFFITFAHHFYNFLCGHAHSIPAVGDALMDQSNGINETFNSDGMRILRELLGINRYYKIDANLGYRILIDVKHMSAKSRKEYYKVVERCRENGDTIPVIASHCGYSGLSTLQDHIDNQDKEFDKKYNNKGPFNPWNINMCDEDIEMIVKTKGLFGISFDQRILGLKKEDDDKRNGVSLVWDNIEGILLSATTNPNLQSEDPLQIWNCITIGTDFEGLIDPVDPYPTAMEFEQFANNLVFVMDQARKDSKNKHLQHLKSREDVVQAVDRFCYLNAEEFVLKHYPKN